MQTSQHDVTLAQGTILYQQGGYGTTPLINARLNHHTLTRCIFHGSQLKQFSLQQDRIQQSIDAFATLGRNMRKLHVTTPLFRQYVTLSQLVLDAVQIGIFLVDLVDSHHQRYTCGFRVLDRFFGLRHHAVVSGNNQYHDVGQLSTACTHGGKRRMPRSIQEGHHAIVGFNVVGTDMLGNATRFTGCHLGATDVVKQRGLAVVNVTHDSYHRCTANLFTLSRLNALDQRVFNGIFLHRNGLVTHLFHHQYGGVLIQYLIDGRHSAHLEHYLDDLSGLDRHLLGQFGHGDALRDVHLMYYRCSRLLETMLVRTTAAATACRRTFASLAATTASIVLTSGFTTLATTRTVVIITATRLFLVFAARVFSDRLSQHFGLRCSGGGRFGLRRHFS